MASTTTRPQMVGSGLPPATGRRGDTVFRTATIVAAGLVFLIILAIGVFLLARAGQSLRANTANFFTEKLWFPDNTPSVFGIAALAFGTALTSVLALVMAVPVAIGVALFITDYAPRRLSTSVGYLTDLLAAIPSVVYGLWGLYFLLPRMIGLQQFLADHFGWIPLFADPTHSAGVFAKSVFAASVILAVMILPIVSAISREVLRQVDSAQKEAALALGATRWEMIRLAVLPPSLSGLVSAVMLGLGRALGETIAVALVIGSTFGTSLHILPSGGNTIAANIATRFGESGAIGRSALIASGLVLFVITLLVNLAARAVIYRSGKVERGAAV